MKNCLVGRKTFSRSGKYSGVSRVGGVDACGSDKLDSQLKCRLWCECRRAERLARRELWVGFPTSGLPKIVELSDFVLQYGVLSQPIVSVGQNLPGQRIAGSRSITVNVKDPGRTGGLPRPGPAGTGPNFAETINTR